MAEFFKFFAMKNTGTDVFFVFFCIPRNPPAGTILKTMLFLVFQQPLDDSFHCILIGV